MNILVTGGLGFIGSHTVVELIENNHKVIIVDNLCNSELKVLGKIQQITGVKPDFYMYDVTNEKQMDEIFKVNEIEGIIHFAGLKAVGESVDKPLQYYYNNLLSTIVICRLSAKYNVNKIVFSSSATVYGNQTSPLKESYPLKETTNPYGETKAMNERILIDTSNAQENLMVTILRYFNPIGAHQSGLIGENPNGIPNNLMPYVTKVANKSLPKLTIFGNDYDTIDGTGVRDFIHVVDLARGHVTAIENMINKVNIYNLGTGKGTSVLQLIKVFEKVNNVSVPFEMSGRRSGDLAESYADVTKVREELGWVTKYNLEDMVRDAWRFEQMNN
ncbi:MAG: UDP-glucose 4-epimerase GalE [Erysipelothrix sp.]|nr:UDP-glucose 4-epimerase GalE [Erysipelothrix sp.]